MSAAAIKSFKQHAALAREAIQPARGQPPSFVLNYGTDTSSAITAAISVGGIRMTSDDRGRVSRIQPATISVRVALLPSWAQPFDSLAGSAKVVTAGKTFKISGVANHGETLTLTCLRWPDDADA